MSIICRRQPEKRMVSLGSCQSRVVIGLDGVLRTDTTVGRSVVNSCQAFFPGRFVDNLCSLIRVYFHSSSIIEV
jgi:hypothetical protein